MTGYIELWKNALLKPSATFRAEARKASLQEGIKHMAIAGLVTGVLGFLVATLFSTLLPIGQGMLVGFGFLSIILSPIQAVLGWLVGSGLLYIVALLLGGKGDYGTQSYLIAIYAAPISILTAILGFVPLLGLIVVLLLSLYGLYLLTIALKETHRFTTLKAILTWLVPIVLLVIAAITFLWGMVSTFASAFGAAV